MGGNNHTASGPAAGYFFQPDRALYWLAKCDDGAIVGIETADDVTVHSKSGEVIVREQDKNTIKPDGVLIKDRSNDLWKTLAIWISDLKNDRFDVNQVVLFFATNRSVPVNSLVSKIGTANTEQEVNDLLPAILAATQNPPMGIKKNVDYVLSNVGDLRRLIPRIKLTDDNNPVDLTAEVVNLLHLTPINSSEIVIYLKGWIHDSIVNSWHTGEPAYLKREDFDNALEKAHYRFNSARVQERVKRLVLKDVDETKRNLSVDGLFVKQLEAIDSSDDTIVEAIDDYWCAEIERMRLVLKGDIINEDLKDFDESCEIRWREIRARYSRQYKLVNLNTKLSSYQKEEKFKEIGFSIYDQTACTGFRGVLAGYQTTEAYLTKGTFYVLSNDNVLGWHPKWEEKFTRVTENENNGI